MSEAQRKQQVLVLDRFKASKQGQSVIRRSKESAVNYLFDLESGDVNSEVAKELSPVSIYEALLLTGTLSIEVDGQTYRMEPCYRELASNDALVLEMLADIQANLEISMLMVALSKAETEVDLLPGATAREIMNVDLTSVLEPYDTPDELPEWDWIREKASFEHRDTGREGVWEFVVNVSLDHGPVPSALEEVFKAAQRGGFQYIIFHQGI